MSMFILLSVALALVALPLWAAGDVHPMRGLRKALAGLVAYAFFFAFLLRVVLPRLG